MSKVVIVGAGFGGIGAAIELRRHGFTDVTILEKGPRLGGTWHYNTYPGAACDVPSHLYSFSYAQRRDWERLCPTQPDILAYLEQVARDHGVDRLVVPDTTVTACTYDDARARWTVSTDRGATYEADAIVLATGQLHQPAVPRIAGADRFAGTAFHSAEWDHACQLRGRDVAIVGTGASAVQIVPEIAEQARRLTVFQRSGNWFMPRRNRRYPAPVRAAIEHVPGVQACRRRFVYAYCELLTQAILHPRTLGRLVKARSWLHMRMQLRDPEVRRKAWPDYTFGCKRVLFSSYYLPALQRPNVDLVTERVARIEPDAVVTDDGVRHPADVLIWATGFKTNDFMFPMEVRGAEGRDLRDVWAGGAHAHLGMMVPGFPNMFVLYGPNTNTSGGSILVYLEAQARYLRQVLQLVRARGAAAADVRPEIEARSDLEVQSRFNGTAWVACDSWYRNEHGRIVANWPGSMNEYVARTSTVDPADLRLVERPAVVPA